MNSLPLARLGFGALIVIMLAGCEAGEESAQKIQEKAEQAIQQIAREAVSDTVDAINKQVDEVQQSAQEMLGRQNDREATDKPERDAEAPARLPEGAIET